MFFLHNLIISFICFRLIQGRSGVAISGIFKGSTTHLQVLLSVAYSKALLHIYPLFQSFY